MEPEIKKIIKRIEKLEKAVFGNEKADRVKQFAERAPSNFTGATGGIRFLSAKGFFNAKRTLADVKEELATKGYHYSVQAVQIALNRLSKVGGPLVTLREENRKKYAKRK